MRSNKVKNENFITLAGFMVNDLELKGNELIIYACIYSFSQNNGQFTGSLQYLCNWTKSSKQSMMKCLQSLEEKGFISKEEFVEKKVKRCIYKTCELEKVCNSVGQGYATQLDRGMQLSCTNTISDKKVNKKDINNIPSESLEVVLPLHTTNDLYEVSNQNIDANCTISSSNIKKEGSSKKKSSFQSNPNKYIWADKMFKEFNMDLPKERQFTKPKKNGTKEEKSGTSYILTNLYEKYGEEKATEFINYLIAKSEWRNPFSLITPKNQEEFENFYQEPEQEQPRYLEDRRFSYMERSWGKSVEEPTINELLNEDSYYAAMEWFYSQQLSGNDLVKAVRARIKELNHKYNKY